MALQQKARGERPRYFPDPAVEKILAMTLALAGELAVLHDRVDTIERLAAAGLPISGPAIDAFAPDETVKLERDAWREGFLDVVFRVVHQEVEELQRKTGSSSYDDAISAVEAQEKATRDRVM